MKTEQVTGVEIDLASLAIKDWPKAAQDEALYLVSHFPRVAAEINGQLPALRLSLLAAKVEQRLAAMTALAEDWQL